MNADLEAAAVEAMALSLPWAISEEARRVVAGDMLAAALGTTVERDCERCGGTGQVDLPSPKVRSGKHYATQTIAIYGPCDARCSDGKVLLGIGEVVK
jgi:hypothetical protein